MNWATLLLAVQQMSPVEAVMATIMVIFFVYRGGVNLFPKFKKEEIKDIKNKRDLLPLHSACPNYISLLVIIERAMEKSDAIMRIKYGETLYEQMNEAELAWDDVKDVLKNNYANILNSKKVPEEEKIYAIKCYDLIIDNMEVDVLGLIRRWMRKNHFLEKSDVNYALYIEEKLKQLHHKITKLIDNRYEESKMIVARKYLKESNIDHCLTPITKRTNLFFLRAKEIAVEKAETIKKIKEEIHKI